MHGPGDMQHFPKWFQAYVNDLSNGVTGPQMLNIAFGPLREYTSWTQMNVNGQGEYDCYEFFNEILELEYLGEPKNRTVVFRLNGRGKGDRGNGTGGRRDWPRKRTNIPLNLGEAEAGTSTPPGTPTQVIPTLLLSESLPAMKMIPTLGLRVQSSETLGSRAQRQTLTQTPAQTPIEDDESPPLEPDPMPWPLVENLLPEGEEEDIAAEEALAAKAGHTYLRWDDGNL
ncbi:hypothetical protein PIB30_027241 [Stylosanthes scabra]|uniref:Uncharacterized protein n=1 Tax=Stylosanthes scabra TaxID=79078 RepID=A0ABU6V9Q4_9FABA|nr:hypothetical protein [Stylosanthes scabra]